MWQSRKMFWMQESWLLQRWPLIPLHMQVELKFQQLRCLNLAENATFFCSFLATVFSSIFLNDFYVLLKRWQILCFPKVLLLEGTGQGESQQCPEDFPWLVFFIHQSFPLSVILLAFLNSIQKGIGCALTYENSLALIVALYVMLRSTWSRDFHPTPRTNTVASNH